LKELLEALVAAFNRGSLDVPANLFTPRTTFSLNNRSYESILAGAAEHGGGALSDDPLVRLLARGVAGYRTAAKALQYAVTGARLTIESLSERDEAGAQSASLRLEGQLRDTGEPFDARATLRITSEQFALTSIEVSCREDDLARVAASRRA
jgi:hypothetical protein